MYAVNFHLAHSNMVGFLEVGKEVDISQIFREFSIFLPLEERKSHVVKYKHT